MHIKNTSDFIARIKVVSDTPKQKDLAIKLKMDKTCLSKYATGKMEVAFPMAISWLERLNIDPVDIFNDKKQ